MTIEITHADASAAILRHVDEGRIVQRDWHGHDAEGREIACLLGAIHPSVESAADCNGDLMPLWLAELTLTLFDGLSQTAVLPTARRYGELVGRWHVLSEVQWDRLLTRFLIRVIDDAVDSARPVAADKPYWPQVVAACDKTKAALAGEGDLDDAVEAAAWAAKAAAWAAAEAAAEAAVEAVEAAVEAAEAVEAVEAAEATVRAAVRAAAGAAARAAEATEAAAAAARATVGTIAGSYERLFTFLLDQIASECAAAP